jgi:hypothetical protein
MKGMRCLNHNLQNITIENPSDSPTPTSASAGAGDGSEE